MGIILVPLLFGALCFLIPGTILGVKGVLHAQGRFVAFAVLLGLIIIFHVAEFSAPFLVATGQRVSQLLFFLFTFAATILPATIVGTKMKNSFRESGRPREALVGSALYFSAGVTPFSWFLFTEGLGSFLSISWTP
jgi:uncharacterized membrane protein YhaH (DUF805 family)